MINIPFYLTQNYIFFFFLTFFVNIIYHFILGAKFAIILKYSGEKISLIHAFYLFCIVKFSSIITPFFTGTLISKPILAKHYANVPIRKGIMLTFFEQTIDFLVLIIIFPFTLLALGSSLFNPLTQIIFIIILVIGLFFIILKYELIIQTIWKLKPFLPNRVISIGEKYELTRKNTVQSFKEIKGYFTNKKLLLAIFPFILLQNLLIPVILKLTAATLSIYMSYSVAYLVYFISVTVGKLSGLPGGVGSTDLTMAGLLFFFKMTPFQIAGIIALFRLITLLPAITIGGFLTLYLSVKYSLKFTKGLKEKDT